MCALLQIDTKTSFSLSANTYLHIPGHYCINEAFNFCRSESILTAVFIRFNYYHIACRLSHVKIHPFHKIRTQRIQCKIVCFQFSYEAHFKANKSVEKYQKLIALRKPINTNRKQYKKDTNAFCSTVYQSNSLCVQSFSCAFFHPFQTSPTRNYLLFLFYAWQSVCYVCISVPSSLNKKQRRYSNISEENPQRWFHLSTECTLD